jgi:hypothetical protein
VFGAIPLTLVGIAVSFVAVGLLELCGCASGGFLGRLLYTIITSVFLVWNALRFGWIIYIYYNDNPDDDASVGVIKAFDYFVSYVIGAALLFMLTWVWGRDELWEGVPEFYANEWGAFGFYRNFVVFLYTAAMIFNGGGVSHYLPASWFTELVFTTVMLINTIVGVVILSVSVTVFLANIQKRNGGGGSSSSSSAPALPVTQQPGRTGWSPVPAAAAGPPPQQQQQAPPRMSADAWGQNWQPQPQYVHAQGPPQTSGGGGWAPAPQGSYPRGYSPQR